MCFGVTILECNRLQTVFGPGAPLLPPSAAAATVLIRDFCPAQPFPGYACAPMCPTAVVEIPKKHFPKLRIPGKLHRGIRLVFAISVGALLAVPFASSITAFFIAKPTWLFNVQAVCRPDLVVARYLDNLLDREVKRRLLLRECASQ